MRPGAITSVVKSLAKLCAIPIELDRLFSNMSVMSTLGIKPPGGCHLPLVGWAEFARVIQPLIERHNYGRKVTESITPPNLRSARFASAARDAIVLEFDQPVVWSDALAGQFYLDGERGKSPRED